MEPLVAIDGAQFPCEIDLRYATANNFTGNPLYKVPHCYLHPEAAVCLTKAIELAQLQGYGIKIFDAFRPIEAQQLLWNHTPDPNFLSDPKTGSVPHCRGVAVDLTLVDKKGEVLDMGTEFDAFTPQSHHGNTTISTAAQQHRYILMGIMLSAGWDFYRNEWWHYQLFSCRDYPILSDAVLKTGMIC